MSLSRIIIYAVVTLVVMIGFGVVALFSWWYADRWAGSERRGKCVRGPDADDRTFVVRTLDEPAREGSPPPRRA